jgi:hypothetical protein
MKDRLEDYVKVYKNVISKTLCENIITELDLRESEFATHKFYHPGLDKDYSTGDDCLVLYATVNSNDILMKLLWETLYKYIEELQFEWFNQWVGFSPPKFNKYTSGSTMKEHCDHIHSLFEGSRKGIPKLSMVCLLNDNYTGGEFVMFKDKPYKLEPGDIIIFPSLFLYPHRVDPVLDGIRYSFVSWVW